MLRAAGVVLTSGSRPCDHHCGVADFLAVLSFVAFIAVFLGYVWCMERV